MRKLPPPSDARDSRLGGSIYASVSWRFSCAYEPEPFDRRDAMSRLKLERGTLTLPPKLRRALKVEADGYLEAEPVEDGVLLKRVPERDPVVEAAIAEGLEDAGRAGCMVRSKPSRGDRRSTSRSIPSMRLEITHRARRQYQTLLQQLQDRVDRQLTALVSKSAPSIAAREEIRRAPRHLARTVNRDYRFYFTIEDDTSRILAMSPPEVIMRRPQRPTSRYQA